MECRTECHAHHCCIATLTNRPPALFIGQLPGGRLPGGCGASLATRVTGRRWTHQRPAASWRLHSRGDRGAPYPPH